MHLGLAGDPTRELLRRFDGTVIRDRLGGILVFQVCSQMESALARETSFISAGWQAEISLFVVMMGISDPSPLWGRLQPLLEAL